MARGHRGICSSYPCSGGIWKRPRVFRYPCSEGISMARGHRGICSSYPCCGGNWPRLRREEDPDDAVVLASRDVHQARAPQFRKHLRHPVQSRLQFASKRPLLDADLQYVLAARPCPPERAERQVPELQPVRPELHAARPAHEGFRLLWRRGLRVRQPRLRVRVRQRRRGGAWPFDRRS